jgi:hypothetical protein
MNIVGVRPSQNSRAESPPGEGANRVEKLFALFAVNYGAAFASKWEGVNPDAIKRAWARGLQQFSWSDIEAAVRTLPASDFPPSLPRFVELCAQRRHPSHQFVALPMRYDPSAPEIEAARARCLHTASELGLSRTLGAET